jgi:hypothetical protein
MAKPEWSENTEKTAAAYGRVVDRVEKAIADLEEKTWAVIRAEIDNAIEFEHDLAELSREEIDLLSAYVKRDLEGMYRFIAETGEGVAQWLKLDLDLVEETILKSLLSIADKTSVELLELDHKLKHDHHAYISGEMASPGMLRCNSCGYMMCLTEVTPIETCHRCSNHYFKRVTSLWPHNKEEY